MTQQTYLVSKSQPQLGARVVNGVVAMLVNAATGPKAITNAALAANANFNTDIFPSNYFDTSVAVSANAGVPAAGNGSANGDAYILPEPNSAPVYVDHAAYTPVV